MPGVVLLVLAAGAAGFSHNRAARRRPSGRLSRRLRAELPFQDPAIAAELPAPDAIYDDNAAVALCMNALAQNDTPVVDAGLTVCFNFSSDMCRAAVGGSLEAFRQYARNPTFSQLIDCESWKGERTSMIAASQTRGALSTVMVTVQTRRRQEKKFLWTMAQQRRPPNQGCWLVHECLYVDNAYSQTM